MNVQPAQEVKSVIKQNVSKAAVPPLQTNRSKKEILANTGKVAAVKQVVRKPSIAEQASGKETTLKNATIVKKQPHSQKTEQAAQLKKPAGEAPKPPPVVQPSRPAPGMYKGKIVESKIGSIWKSSVPARNEDQKSTAQNTTNHSAGKRTTSAAGRGTSASTSTRSVKPVVNTRPLSTFSSARPPARSVPITVRPRNATVAQNRRCGTLIAKPKVPATDIKASKPPVTSTVRQYRSNSETAEEKRAKLAEWLASKGKTLKRPAMVPPAASTKVKTTTKPAAVPKSQMKSQLSTKSRSEAEAKEPKAATPALTADSQEMVQEDKRTSLIMNTTLELLENSDLDLPVYSQDGGNGKVDDVVINLCDALEALETPSQCDNELPQLKDEANEESKLDVKSETPDNGMVKTDGDISDDQEVQYESEESDDDCYVDENVPPTEGASVVKYSIKTTPFLQSVKKTIEGEVCSSSAKRKSNIKDLKFLTPVRRSSRIHRQSSRLPTMLVDHDPCVSSLAELVKLDDDPNAYIYRKNPALLEDLPDQPRL